MDRVSNPAANNISRHASEGGSGGGTGVEVNSSARDSLSVYALSDVFGWNFLIIEECLRPTASSRWPLSLVVFPEWPHEEPKTGLRRGHEAERYKVLFLLAG